MGDANEFRGRIGRYRSDSEAWWPEPERAAEGSPNVVVIVLDDVGFAQLGCFGSDLDTPTLDGVAARGLRFTNWSWCHAGYGAGRALASSSFFT